MFTFKFLKITSIICVPSKIYRTKQDVHQMKVLTTSDCVCIHMYPWIQNYITIIQMSLKINVRMYLTTKLQLKIPLIHVNNENGIFLYYNFFLIIHHSLYNFMSVDRCDTKVETLKSYGLKLVVNIYFSFIGNNKIIR